MADLRTDGEMLIARLERAAQQRDEHFRSVESRKRQGGDVAATSAPATTFVDWTPV